MKIVWVYNVYADADGHITTWREMHRHLTEAHDIHFIFPFLKRRTGFTSNISYVRHDFFIPYVKRLIFVLNTARHFLLLSYKIKPDIVILDLWTCWLSFLPLPRRGRIKYFLDFRTCEYNENSDRSTPRDGLIKFGTRLALKINRRCQTGASFISEALRESLTIDLREPVNPNYVIWPSGVDTSVFSPERYPAPERGKFRIVFHGQLSFNRGLHNVVESIPALVNKNIPVELVIVGDGVARRSLERLVEDKGLRRHVHFLGFRPPEEIPGLIAAADLAVMAYPLINYWEVNVPLKILEYMAMGKAVILTKLKVFREIVGPAACGLFIDDNEPGSISGAIEHAFHHRSRLAEWGRSGRERAREIYEWRSVAEKFSRFLESSATDAPRRAGPLHPPIQKAGTGI